MFYIRNRNVFSFHLNQWWCNVDLPAMTAHERPYIVKIKHHHIRVYGTGVVIISKGTNCLWIPCDPPSLKALVSRAGLIVMLCCRAAGSTQKQSHCFIIMMLPTVCLLERIYYFSLYSSQRNLTAFPLINDCLLESDHTRLEGAVEFA